MLNLHIAIRVNQRGRHGHSCLYLSESGSQEGIDGDSLEAKDHLPISKTSTEVMFLKSGGIGLDYVITLPSLGFLYTI